jgi:RNA polymerase sigma-70 factor (ECF subfamily)
VRNLLDEYVPRVFRFAMRLSRDHHTAEDLTQETLLRAWRHRDRLREPHTALVWLMRITQNLWLDHLRRRKHPVGQAAPLCTEVVDKSDAAIRTVGDQDEARMALGAMDSLPSRQREVLYLHACEGFTHVEISEVLGISPDAVKANLSLARKKMRELLRGTIFHSFPNP